MACIIHCLQLCLCCVIDTKSSLYHVACAEHNRVQSFLRSFLSGGDKWSWQRRARELSDHAAAVLAAPTCTSSRTSSSNSDDDGDGNGHAEEELSEVNTLAAFENPLGEAEEEGPLPDT